MTELTTIDTNNYAELWQSYGHSNEAVQKKASMLASSANKHIPILGDDKVLVKGYGTYKLEIPDGPTYYARVC